MMQQFLVNAAKSTDISSIASPESAVPIASGPVLMNEATVAYAKGASSLARQLYFGHMVAEFENASEQLSMVKYSPALKRPVWQVRWGISMEVRGDATDPQPITDSPSRTGGMSSGMASSGMYGGPSAQEQAMMAQGSSSSPSMDYGSGIGGNPTAYAAEQTRDRSANRQQQMADAYGSSSSSYPGVAGGSPGAPGMSGGPGGPGGQNGFSFSSPAAQTPGDRLSGLDRSMLSEAAAKELEDNLGAVATFLAEQFDQRYAEGNFGRAMIDVSDGAGQQDAVSGSFVDLLETAESDLPMWRPGIVYLGMGDADVHLANAKKAGLDLLIHINVSLKETRGENTQNISKCRLFHVDSKKQLVVSKGIDSIEYNQQSKTKGVGAKEYIGEQMSSFLPIVDRQMTVELPRLTSDVAVKRIGSLLASGGSKSLATLAEVRLFQSQGLLNDDQVLQVFDIVGGEEGLQILYGTEEEKLTVVRKWIADQYKSTPN